MKKTIFISLIAFIATGCSTCKKEAVLSTAPSITVLSPKGGETLYADEDSTVSFSVTWKSANLPKGAMIEAELSFEESGGPNSTGTVNVILEPVHKQVVHLYTTDVMITDNDGQEIFKMPSHMKTGDPLITVPNVINPKKILLTVVYPTADGKWDSGFFSNKRIQGTSANYFSVRFLPNGCSLPSGFSSTSGQPCKLLN